MSWYRQYRPTNIEGLHLKSVRSSLQKLLDNRSLPHALLFTGPKGTGKTSAARIIGALLNDPVNAEVVEQIFFAPDSQGKAKFQPVDIKQDITRKILEGTSFIVNEIDAASNRGIDEIRLLRERVFLPPAEGKISVYILDEVHMLTTEAFNALLKILEEPPAHVVFILATTELHKIPATVVSRCTVIQFHRASAEELSEALTSILKQEKITIDPEALAKIVMAADGSFRDGVKLLETVAKNQTKVTEDMVAQYLHFNNSQAFSQLLKSILEKDEKKVVEVFAQLRTTGADPQFFYKSFLQYLHQKMIDGFQGKSPDVTPSPKISHYLLHHLNGTSNEKDGAIPFLTLELKVLELLFRSKEKNGESVSPSKPSTSLAGSTGPKKAAQAVTPSGEPIVIHTNTSPAVEYLAVTTESNDLPVIGNVETVALAVEVPPLAQLSHSGIDEVKGSEFIDGQQLVEKWEEFLQSVRQKNSSIEALLRSSKPVATETGKTKIEVYYQFHREQLQQPKFVQMMEECVSAVTGGKVILEFTLASQAGIGASLSTVSGQVNEEEQLIKLAKEILV
jgi:DNA polymerase-3 subunit gamma/tau